MQKTKQTRTKLLTITITTAAIIAAVTITISLSAATPAFAKVNCNETITICSGGESNKKCDRCFDAPGGAGSRIVSGESFSGGFGGQISHPGNPTEVGGGGAHCTSSSGVCVGGSGQHVQGPGGNSD